MISGNPVEQNINKCCRKQRRAYHRLVRDMNIECCDDPTEYLVICNAGLVTGLRRQDLQSAIDKLKSEYIVIMVPGKSYCFMKFPSKIDAKYVYDRVHGKVVFEQYQIPIYVSYCKSVPNVDSTEWNPTLPLGCTLIENFITEEQEERLIKSISWNKEQRSHLKHRRVVHFGYEFQYGTNNIDFNNPIKPIPEDYNFLQSLFEKHGCGRFKYDQLTINYYLPGQGIPPHIDTHSAFEDIILSLSLGSSCVMDFKRNNQKANVIMPARSLLIMAGETRYAWTHGISPRHSDVVQTSDGITLQPRGTRISFTFRKVHVGSCQCNFPEFCDSKKLCPTSIANTVAVNLERRYVHDVYNEISNHFNETRHQQWPNVTKFLESLESGSIVVDAGCGNGKYLHEKQNMFKLGCDRSIGLMEICRQRGCEVVVSDCLQLPYKNDSIDAIISIAVIHHFSTQDRRKQAIKEMIRVLRVNGKCLIYVWAKEQNLNSVKSTYLKYGARKSRENEEECMKEIAECEVILPVHRNRTEFTHSDMLVPWKRKGGGDFLRYYHVFEEGELSLLCTDIPNILIENVYYDQGNWCIILKKMYSR